MVYLGRLFVECVLLGLKGGVGRGRGRERVGGGRGDSERWCCSWWMMIGWCGSGWATETVC